MYLVFYFVLTSHATFLYYPCFTPISLVDLSPDYSHVGYPSVESLSQVQLSDLKGPGKTAILLAINNVNVFVNIDSKARRYCISGDNKRRYRSIANVYFFTYDFLLPTFHPRRHVIISM